MDTQPYDTQLEVIIASKSALPSKPLHLGNLQKGPSFQPGPVKIVPMHVAEAERSARAPPLGGIGAPSSVYQNSTFDSSYCRKRHILTPQKILKNQDPVRPVRLDWQRRAHGLYESLNSPPRASSFDAPAVSFL